MVAHLLQNDVEVSEAEGTAAPEKGSSTVPSVSSRRKPATCSCRSTDSPGEGRALSATGATRKSYALPLNKDCFSVDKARIFA